MPADAAADAWLQFGTCAALIAIAGTRLSRYGDVIADKTGLSGAWIGLVLLAIVALVAGGESIYRRVSQGQILAVAFGIVLIGFAGVNIVLGNHGFAFPLGHIGAYTPIIVALYVVAVRAVFVYERSGIAAYVEQSADRYPQFTLAQAALRYAAAALAASAMSAMVMTGIVIVGVLYRPRRRLVGPIGWIGLGLLAVYLLNTYALYLGSE